MFKKSKNILFLIISFVLIFFVINYYFSEKNRKFTNKSRILYIIKLENSKKNLPKLKSDTENIITYINDLEKFKKKKKKRLWENLITDNNE